MLTRNFKETVRLRPVHTNKLDLVNPSLLRTLKDSIFDLSKSRSFLYYIYVIIKCMRTLWLVNQLWFIVPVNSWKFRVSSELSYKSNRPQVFMVYRLINHLGCWKNTRRIRKSLACGSWFTNSSRALPTSRMVYQPINHKNLWSIVYILLCEN